MLIDLSVVLNEQTPAFPGDAPTKIESANRLERDGNNDHYISMNNHAGTHIDAPWHVLANGKHLDEIPLEQFVGRGRLITLKDGQFNLQQVQQADIAEGDIVLFNTGMSQYLHDQKYFESYPAMTEEIASYLVECKVKMVGADTGGIDNNGTLIHRTLLAGDVLIIENLTNLDQLIDKEFTVYALPIKLDIDGAPARVIAHSSEEDRT